MQTITKNTLSIQAVVDARSQFVAFACSSIVRQQHCAAKTLATSHALCAEFGRAWVAGCSRQIGATLILSEREHNWGDEMVKAHVFIGLSATHGVVWCTCVDAEGDFGSSIRAAVGDNRFVQASLFGCEAIVDRRGNHVMALAGELPPASLGLWVHNRRWLVWVEMFGASPEARKLVVWRLSGGGVPVGPSSSVKCTVPVDKDGAGFSRLDPCGDELVVVGNEVMKHGENDGDEKVGIVSFVDLEKSVHAGVTVETKKSLLLPYPDPFALAWSSSDTILTLHNDSTMHKVYNTNTRQVCTFPSQKYCGLSSVPPAHIIAWSRSSDNRPSLCEVYCTADLSHPTCQYEDITCGRSSSSTAIYAVEISPMAIAKTGNILDLPTPPGQRQLVASIRDATTGKPMATVILIQARLSL